jgi:crotonobetainyl-CoA:carnitine CoA-transferase CaiB-like acyl-CoA transferase
VSTRPLTGVTVIDLTRIVSGPLACYYLAALGADVLRVDPPGGDMTWRAPPFVGPNGVHRGPRGDHDFALAPLRRSRGKRSLVVDIKHPRGRALVLDLLRGTDVLVENFRPGVMDGLGLSPDVLMAANPRLLHCSITGFGHAGPYHDRPAMDVVVQAMSGFLAKTGFPDGPPVKSGVMIGDQLTSVFAALAIVAALRQRELDGRGRFVDVTMFESLLNLLWDEPVDHYAEIGLPSRSGNVDLRSAPLGVYETADGHVAIVLTDDRQWRALCGHLGRADLARLTSADRQGDVMIEVNDVVGRWCRAHTTVECMAAFDDCDLPAGAVEPPSVGRTDPHVAALGSLEQLEGGPDGAPTPFLGARVPFRIGDVDLRASPAEPLGSSTDAVLRERCGLDDETLAELRAEGVIG